MIIAVIPRNCEAGHPMQALLRLSARTWIPGLVDLRITHPDESRPDAGDVFDDARGLAGLGDPARNQLQPVGHLRPDLEGRGTSRHHVVVTVVGRQARCDTQLAEQHMVRPE